NPERLTRMSERNLLRAQDYRPEVLAARREGFYRFLRSATEDWIALQKREPINVRHDVRGHEIPVS
ncbi:MAG TPA: hypothetical protein VH744_09885, partial [Terriglobales bacterium]